MVDGVARTLLWLVCCGAVLGGCVPPQQVVVKPAAVVPAAVPAAEVAPAATATPAASLDPQAERRLVKDLVRDVDEYHRLVREKNVDQASFFVVPERRPGFKDELWEFVARYKLESASVASYQLLPRAGGVTGKVKVSRTVFEKASVVPQKSEVWMTWEHLGDGWVLQPEAGQTRK